MDAPPPLTPARLVGRGLTRRCPLCGRRGIFTSWFGLRDRCPTCHYPTNRVEDQWIGALGINMMVTFGLLAGALAVGFAVTYPDPPVGVLLAVIVPIAAFFPVLFYPLSKSLWAAIDLAMRGPTPDDDVDPIYLPRARRTGPT